MISVAELIELLEKCSQDATVSVEVQGVTDWATQVRETATGGEVIISRDYDHKPSGDSSR